LVDFKKSLIKMGLLISLFINRWIIYSVENSKQKVIFGKISHRYYFLKKINPNDIVTFSKLYPLQYLEKILEPDNLPRKSSLKGFKKEITLKRKFSLNSLLNLDINLNTVWRFFSWLIWRYMRLFLKMIFDNKQHIKNLQ